MKTLKAAVFFIISLAPSAVIADSIENYFTADGYQCDRNTYIVEWSVIGDTNGDVTIQRFLRREGRARSSFEGLTWQFPATDLSGSVVASDANNRALYEFTNMLSDNPKIIALDRRGRPRNDCPFTLETALSPRERFATTIAALSIAEPTTDNGRLVDDHLAHLPPAAMLPTLSQASTESEVQNAINPFWERYETTLLARAANVEDVDLLTEAAQFWIEQSTNQRSRFHGKLLLRIQDIRANALRQQNEDPSQLAVLEGDALCSRIDGLNISWNWDDYLELATGLPLEYWNETLAEDFLASTVGCEEADTFQNVLSRRWPDVQARIAAFDEVIAERDRIASLDISLETVVKENWLSADSGRLIEWYRQGISQDDALEILSPALETQKEAAIALLPTVLGDEARAQTIELGEFSSWCDRRRWEIGYAYNNDLQDAVFEACNVELAAQLREQAIEAIDARKNELLSAPQDIETLVATAGYSFEGVIPRLHSNNPAFAQTIADINAAVTSAQQETEDRYLTVLKSTMENITATFTSADPMGDSARTANELCEPFIGFGIPQRLQPISTLCQNLSRDLQERRQEAECDVTWSKMEAPEDIQRGQLNVPQLLGGTRPVNIRTLVCDSTRSGFSVWIAEDGGWFSSEFRLHREAKLRTGTVEMSVRLNEPEADTATWTADDPAISSGTIGLSDKATSEDIMGCFYYPETCYQP